jgi:nucleoside-diphosphate-sugar epimerase
LDRRPILLITGASGRIGGSYRRHLAQINHPYQLRYTDIKPPKQSDDLEGEWLIGNLSELDFAHQVVEGVDTILHLGADPDPEADFYNSLLENNIKATYNLFYASAEAKVKKVVYGSSSSVVFGYKKEEPGVQLITNLTLKPITMYSATKCFGEATAAVFAQTRGINVFCIRIGWFILYEELINQSEPDLEIMSRILTDRDFCHLVDCCLKTDGINYAILNGVSNNRYPFLDLSETRKLVGYNPQDDSFALSGIIRQNKE